tara:strand:- start:280 stop:555 length:276 start_codon:yes stop_codon:yes gene_type:complete
MTEYFLLDANNNTNNNTLGGKNNDFNFIFYGGSDEEIIEISIEELKKTLSPEKLKYIDDIFDNTRLQRMMYPNDCIKKSENGNLLIKKNCE